MKRFFLVALLVIGLFSVLAAAPWAGVMKSAVDGTCGTINIDFPERFEVGTQFNGDWEFDGDQGPLPCRIVHIVYLDDECSVSWDGVITNGCGRYIGEMKVDIIVDMRSLGSRNMVNVVKALVPTVRTQTNTGSGLWKFNDDSHKGVIEINKL